MKTILFFLSLIFGCSLALERTLASAVSEAASKHAAQVTAAEEGI